MVRTVGGKEQGGLHKPTSRCAGRPRLDQAEYARVPECAALPPTVVLAAAPAGVSRSSGAAAHTRSFLISSVPREPQRSRGTAICPQPQLKALQLDMASQFHSTTLRDKATKAAT